MRQPRRCTECDYIVDHLTEHRCLECGCVFDPNDPAANANGRGGRSGIRLLLAAVLVPSVSFVTNFIASFVGGGTYKVVSRATFVLQFVVVVAVFAAIRKKRYTNPIALWAAAVLSLLALGVLGRMLLFVGRNTLFW